MIALMPKGDFHVRALPFLYYCDCGRVLQWVHQVKLQGKEMICMHCKQRIDEERMI